MRCAAKPCIGVKRPCAVGLNFLALLRTVVIENHLEMASGLENSFIVKPDLADSTTWYSWITTYNLMDGNGLYQQILFTAPTGTQLSQGENSNLDINFPGVITTDAGWSASWDDRLAPAPLSVPEPGSLALLGLGMAGIMAVSRRKNKQ